MSAARVEKNWKATGLRAYPTSAIIATLNHYGVALTAESFAADQRSYDVLLAEWTSKWTGAGQFADLPSTALTALWLRLKPTIPSPHHLAIGVAQVITAAAGDFSTVAPARIKAMAEMIERLPTEVEARHAFLVGTNRAFDEIHPQLRDVLQAVRDDALFGAIATALYVPLETDAVPPSPEHDA